MSIPVVRGMKLVIEYALSGNRFSSGFVFTSASPLALTDPADLVGAFRGSAAETAFLAMLSVEAQLVSVYAFALSPDSAVAFREPGTTSDVGVVSGDPAPSNLAAVATLIQTEVGSKANGRFYVSGFGDSAFDGGTAQFTTGFQSLLQTFADAMLAGLGGFSLGVLSKQSGGVPVVPPVIYPVGTVVARLPVRQQRRRVTEVRSTS